MTLTGELRHAATAPHATPAAAQGPRRDIQGLRALAVGLVVLSHFWPARLPGGFVGVDVFFVISGFLITSHLVTKPPTRGRDLAAFWGRRIRRLLPAATLVLLVSLVGSVLFLPETALARVAHETAAASWYGENWALAQSATDYFAVDDLHTPVQHYWSLSVEEQFYIVWPLVIAAALLASRRVRRRVPWVALSLGAVFVASLAYSFFFTAKNPTEAYYVTPTRMWELALGGLVALAVVRGRLLVRGPLTALLAWAGLAAIVAAALLYDGTTLFPGVAALLPTVGAALVIAAAADGVKGSPHRLWRARGVQLTGDISYSIYLWHWPLIVIVPFVLNRTLFWPEKLALATVAFALAWATKLLVEDPVRRSRFLSRPLWRSYVAGAVLMALTVSGATAVAAHERSASDHAATSVSEKLASADCVGAAAMRDKGCDLAGKTLLTPATYAKDDKSELYSDNCWNLEPFTDRITCTYGSSNPTKRIALVGNSHAGYWEPALKEIALENNWQITTYVATECYTVDAVQIFATKAMSQNCRDTARWQIDSVAKGHYDLVVAADRTARELAGVPASERGDRAQSLYGQTLDRWTKAGEPVLVMRDIPMLDESTPDCVAEHPDNFTPCSTPQKRAQIRDPLAEAAQSRTADGVTVYDATNRFCRDGVCYGVIGGVIAYFNKGHMTAAYSKTLTPDVEPAVMRALEASPAR